MSDIESSLIITLNNLNSEKVSVNFKVFTSKYAVLGAAKFAGETDY